MLITDWNILITNQTEAAQLILLSCQVILPSLASTVQRLSLHSRLFSFFHRLNVFFLLPGIVNKQKINFSKPVFLQLPL